MDIKSLAEHPVIYIMMQADRSYAGMCRCGDIFKGKDYDDVCFAWAAHTILKTEKSKNPVMRELRELGDAYMTGPTDDEPIAFRGEDHGQT